MADVLNNVGSDEGEIRGRYGLTDSAGWKVAQLKGLKYDANKIVPFLYKPFDSRWIYYDRDALGRARWRTMRHMLKPNVALVSTRQVTRLPFTHVFVSKGLIEEKTGSHDRTTQIFPLFTYGDSNYDDETADPVCAISEDAQEVVSTRLLIDFITRRRSQSETAFDCLDLFHYIYAVLHSPSYRERYGQRLLGDFARIPFTSDVMLFWKLAGAGAKLVSLHTLDGQYPRAVWQGDAFGNARTLCGKGRSLVTRGFPSFRGDKVFINQDQWFGRVLSSVWKFNVGGYQVAAKWLKDRQECFLSVEDSDRYGRLLSAIDSTLTLMAEVDSIISTRGGWPLRGSVDGL
jgi:hypothetical protein